MKRQKGSVRKVRSDKKMDVQPTMSVVLKDQLYTFAHLSEAPVKDIALRLCELAMEDSLIIEEIRQYFRRNYKFKNNLTPGYLERPRLKIILKGNVGKVSIKFPQPVYDRLCTLAFALDLPPTTTASILIKRTLFNEQFMEGFIRSELKHLTEPQRNQAKLYLRQIWRYKS